MTKLVLRRPVSTLLVILAVAVFGVYSMFGLRMELMPEMEMPMLVVMTVYPGAAPNSVEKLVTKGVEDAGGALSGIDSVTSYSYENYSLVLFTYDYGVDIGECYSDLSIALDGVAFPEEAQEPMILELSLSAMPTVEVSIEAPNAENLLSYVEDSIVPEIEAMNEVAKVDIYGGEENYVQVLLREDLMSQYGLSINSIAGFIAAADFSVPAGSVEAGTQDIGVVASSDLVSLSGLRDVPLLTATGSQITLRDVADIAMGAKPAGSLSRYNGEESIILAVTKNQSAGSVSVAGKVVDIIEGFQAENPEMRFQLIYNAGEYIVKALSTIGETLLIGVACCMAVLLFFTGDIKASLIVGASMPVSVLLGLCCMRLLGYTLNLMTAGSLIIAIGMIVDNSIVVLESCIRMREQGASYREAALSGSGTVMMSVVAATVTTLVVYLPLTFMKGLTGQMFVEFGWTIIFVLSGSLLSAVTIVPLAFLKLKPKPREDFPVNKFLNKVTDAYGRFMPKLFRHKIAVIFIAVGLFLGSVALALTLHMELVPVSYDGSISLTAKFRPGTRVESIDEQIRPIEEALLADENFDEVSLSVSGDALSGVAASGTAAITAYSAEGSKRSSEAAVEYYTDLFKNMTNMDLTISGTGGGIMSAFTSYLSSDVVVNLQGNDLESLKAAAKQVKAVIKAVPGVIKVDSDAEQASTQAGIQIDPKKAMAAGLTPAQVAMDLYFSVSGVEASTMVIDDEEYSIRLEYPEESYGNVNGLMNKTISTPYGTSVALSEIAKLTYGEELETRVRKDGSYQVALTASPTESARWTAGDRITKSLKGLELPEGVEIVQGDAEETMYEELYSMLAAIAFGIFLVFLVMAIQFESPRFSLMVMVSIPFCLIGSFLVMFLMRTTFSLISLMGFLTLVGTVVNNGILFVDTADQLKADMPVEQALIKSGQIRLRPILMTTLTTVLAMMPTAFTTDPDTQMIKGMSMVIAGGLMASTLLILLLQPDFYMVMAGKKAQYLGLPDDVKERLRTEGIPGARPPEASGSPAGEPDGESDPDAERPDLESGEPDPGPITWSLEPETAPPAQPPDTKPGEPALKTEKSDEEVSKK